MAISCMIIHTVPSGMYSRMLANNFFRWRYPLRSSQDVPARCNAAAQYFLDPNRRGDVANTQLVSYVYDTKHNAYSLQLPQSIPPSVANDHRVISSCCPHHHLLESMEIKGCKQVIAEQ